MYEDNKYNDNLDDYDLMKRVIDSRSPEHYLIPLYINLFGKKYAILDLDNIINSVPKSSFKVGFGTSHSVVGNHKNFPTGQMYLYNCEDTFKYTDEETSIDTHYFILEESYMTGDSPVEQEINMWIDCLFNKVEDNVKRYKEFTSNISNNTEEVEEHEYSDDDIEDDESGDEYFE